VLVKRVMSENPVVVHPDASISEVRSLMEREKVGHIPVLDKAGALAGIITRKDVAKAEPSAATSLDVHEIGYLLSKITVKTAMQKNVVSVDENEVIEEAARIMADRAIGCLPIMRGGLLVGIITDTDLFRIFVDALGAREAGVRITCDIEEKPGQIAKLAQTIAEKGGNIVSFITFDGRDRKCRRVTLKIQGLSLAEIEAVAKSFPGLVCEDIRE